MLGLYKKTKGKYNNIELVCQIVVGKERILPETEQLFIQFSILKKQEYLFKKLKRKQE